MLVRSSRLRQAEVDLETQRFRADQAVKEMRAARVRAEAAERKLHERPTSYLDSLAHTKVIAHTTAGSLEGVLFAVYEDTIVLRHARFLDPSNEGNVVPLDGEQVIDQDKIEWVQALPPSVP